MSDPEKMAPVQGYIAGIPWSMHLRAYDVYCKMYGRQQALVEGGCRGGFGVSELDRFIPGWREELSEIGRLKRELTSAQAEVKKLRTALETLGNDWGNKDEPLVKMLEQWKCIINKALTPEQDPE
jgi:hypothetical protein